MIRLGIIGAGSIVQSHIRAATLAGFSPMFICGKENSVRAKELSVKNPGLRALPNVDAILESEVDALLIATSTESSIEILNKCLRRGIPLLIEKPVSLEIAELIELAKKNLSHVRVGYNRRFYSSVEKFKEEISNQEGHFLANIPELATLVKSDYRLKRESILGNSVHVFDLLRYLIGEIQFCNIHRFITNDSLNSIHAQIKFESQIVGSINVLFNIPESYELKYWSRGKTLELKPLETYIKTTKIKIISVDKENSTKKYIKEDFQFPLSERDRVAKPGFLGQYEEFKKLIVGDIRHCRMATIDDALQATTLASTLID